MTPIKIFVYGTLKKAYGNHRLLHGAEFVGEDAVRITAIESSGCPFATFTNDDKYPWLKGEVYIVKDEAMLNNLDRLEGHPSWYERKDFKTRNGLDVQAYTYPCSTKSLPAELLVAENTYEWNR